VRKCASANVCVAIGQKRARRFLACGHTHKLAHLYSRRDVFRCPPSAQVPQLILRGILPSSSGGIASNFWNFGTCSFIGVCCTSLQSCVRRAFLEISGNGARVLRVARENRGMTRSLKDDACVQGDAPKLTSVVDVLSVRVA
jgi:hypothetical protein